MPNWCRNILNITGPVDDVSRFQREAVGVSPWNKNDPVKQPSPLNFHSLVPIPPEVLRAGYTKAGHDWECEHWGCKWGACKAYIDTESPGAVSYWFETPWCPPIQFLETVSHQFPSLRFEMVYFEEMNHYQGAAVAQDGEVQNDFVNQAR